MKITKQPNTWLYETDIQVDFSLRTGRLFVHANKPWNHDPYGAEARLPNIYALHDYATKNGWGKCGSVDRHFYEDAELIRNQGGIFTDHCMNGTLGQLRLAQLEPQRDVYIRSKDGPMLGIRNHTIEELNMYLNSGSQIIFEKQSYEVDTNPNFKRMMELMMRADGDEEKKFVFDGFATDYCVPAALLATAKYKTKYNPKAKLYLVHDAIEAVDIDFAGKIDPEFGKKAIDKMVQAGAILVSTRDVLEGRI